MTIEESWKIVNQEMHLLDNSLGKHIHDATWKNASENQKKIDIEKAWQIIVTEFYNNKRLDKDVFIKVMEE